jgi:urease subunit gamma/beta
VALTPKEIDRLHVFAAAELARRRLARGLPLNHPEALALLIDEIFEEARAGSTFEQVIAHARSILRRGDVMEGVPEMIRVVQVDAMFADSSRLVTVHNPIEGGSSVVPGQIYSASEPIEVNAGLPVTTIPVTNTGDVPVHLTAHFHVFEANPRLQFDRRAAWGMRPDVAANGSVRIEPGQTVELTLVPLGGARIVRGFSGAVNGPLDEASVDDALAHLKARGLDEVFVDVAGEEHRAEPGDPSS